MSLAVRTICLETTTMKTMPQKQQQQQQQFDTNHREMPQKRPEHCRQTEIEIGKRKRKGEKHMQTKVNQSILELTNCVKQYL